MAIVVLSGLHASVRGIHSTLMTAQYGLHRVDNRRDVLTDEQCRLLDDLQVAVNEAMILADDLARAIPAYVPAHED